MKNFLLVFIAFQSLLALSGSASFADVIFYNFDTGRTLAFYLQDNFIFRVECPGMVILKNGRADCYTPTKVMALSDVNEIVMKNLGHAAKPQKDLDPLSADAVTTLLQGPPHAQTNLENIRNSLLAEQKNFQDIVEKFGVDPGLKTKIDSNAAAMASIDQQLQENLKYTATLNDFTPLLKTYLDMIINPDTKVELVAAKIKDTLAGSLTQIFAHYAPSMGRQDARSISVGDVITVKTNAICHSCSERKSKPLWGVSGNVTDVTRTYDGVFVQLIINGKGGWWLVQDVQKGDDDDWH